MPCFHPLTGYKGHNGKLVFKPTLDAIRNQTVETMTVPCGQCIGCRLDRSCSWAIRSVHEAQLHTQNCFITLTYNNQNLPKNNGLQVEHFQLFMKRLRKHYEPKQIRFFHCGEYGDLNKRPHYHACLYGIDFDDKEFHSVNNGVPLMRSPTLEKLWPFGYSTVGEVTWQSAAYTARYIMKKITGEDAQEHYESVDQGTGEIITRKPEYVTMSRRPGIGYHWYQKYKSDVYPSDYVIINGRKYRPPRYYDLLLEEENPELHAKLKSERIERASEHEFDNKPERLETREYCLATKIRRLPRQL